MIFRTMKLEDGEEVTMLRGSKKFRKDPYGDTLFRSAEPHSGYWGPKTSYLLVPCKPSRRVKVLLGLEPTLEDRSGDSELLLIGKHEVIQRLLKSGPSWCRGLRRSPRPGAGERLKQILVSAPSKRSF